MRIRTFVNVASTLLCYTMAAPALATVVLIAGTLNSVDSGLAGTFHTGQQYLWTYTFDPNAPDFNATATRGEYRTAISTGTPGSWAFRCRCRC